ncbi:hypothetical protein B0J15DRAFT_476839 [Fusarium solani]|uniref:Zn(2)-C6 fungal-type domain-containing protein n=2 Tax=Fusarium solani TaxID=169388 RepID=A0A9P9L357_FUSSL|nr:uncharacterized protein B0J15DRAFT_476839 [Fusarium solani]KAH7273301.1 hypothetical protein B0J15DRAFT_476839 [Fusarium solani]
MPPLQGRKRSKLACETCRDLKRKCDGAQPCAACVRFEYECVYKGPRKRRTEQSHDPVQSSPAQEVQPLRSPHTTSSPNHLRSLEANSGAAFLRRLALRLDPKNAPRMHTFAWNAFLGARKTGVPPVCRPITDMLSQADMQSLAAVYYEKVDTIYGFIDRQDIQQHIESRWTVGEGQSYDAVLCGMAALGCLHSQVEPMPVELDLVESARFLLEQTMSDIPSAIDVTAWILRVVYLRAVGTPHTAWMASCTLMHLAEAAGLHWDPSDESVLPSPAPEVDAELRRRLLAVAQHLNIWISYDMGRSRVALCNATMEMPSVRPGDFTVELMELLPLSADLDPQKAPAASDLESSLTAVLSRVHSVPPSILAQCNLTLCLCRRLQSMNTSFTGTMLDQILSITAKGIEAAQTILDARSPWHHMANVPFQVVCVLLAIDTVSSISQLKDAMQCLSNVATVYNTDATREALNTASLLILMHQKRKEKCASDLNDILKLFPVAPLQEAQAELPPQQMDDMRWLNSLAGDLSSLDYSDFDRFLFPAMF